MSHYQPPHRKQEDSVHDLGGPSSLAYQQASWQALGRTITGIINRVSADTLAASAAELFRENIVRGRGLLARSLCRTQQVDPDLTPVLCALVSRINHDFPVVVLLLCKRLVMMWRRAHARRDWRYLGNVNKFISWLYIFQVLHVGVVYQIILAHLTSPTRTEDDVDQASGVFRETFKAMSQRARGEFYHQILTPFRDMLAADDDELRLSTRSQAVLESCLRAVQEWERVKDEVEFIPPGLVLFDLDDQKTHEVDLEARYATEDQLDRFAMDAQYEEHEEQYEVARRAILGEDWERRLLEEVAAAEDEDDDTDDDVSGDDANKPRAISDETSQEGATTTTTTTIAEGERAAVGNARSRDTNGSASAAAAATRASAPSSETTLDAAKPIVDAREREVRKSVYLAMRSSVRADEAVHKILTSLLPQTERTVCFMIIEGCCEERSYKRLYGMTAERLCKSNARFQVFFVEAFHQRYAAAHDLTVKQIEYTCAIFSHLLRTESLYWSRCLGVMDIVYNDESQRLFIQHLFQQLGQEMGLPAVLDRLQNDREVQMHTRRLLPLDSDAATLERCINLYVAMDLGKLTAPLRAALNSVAQSRKRARAGLAEGCRDVRTATGESNGEGEDDRA